MVAERLDDCESDARALVHAKRVVAPSAPTPRLGGTSEIRWREARWLGETCRQSRTKLLAVKKREDDIRPATGHRLPALREREDSWRPPERGAAGSWSNAGVLSSVPMSAAPDDHYRILRP